jgi:phosphopantetheinyl transferase (holo-ACP synthase)
MIGNDVVDLILAKKESNWKRRGFLDKIFTADEQQLIASATDSEIMVWTLWTMKEAAYKIYNRESGIRAFIPLKIQCAVDIYTSRHQGIVTIDDKQYITRSGISKDFIHTIAVVDPKHLKKVQVFEGIKTGRDNNGLPYLKDGNSIINYAVSKSHHGRYNFTISLC